MTIINKKERILEAINTLGGAAMIGDIMKETGFSRASTQYNLNVLDKEGLIRIAKAHSRLSLYEVVE